MPSPRVLILGTRGVPAAHGGFESFAEKLALFLVERGWRVTVYCQDDVAAVTQRFATDTWRGIERVNVQVARGGRARHDRVRLAFDAACRRAGRRVPGARLQHGDLPGAAALRAARRSSSTWTASNGSARNGALRCARGSISTNGSARGSAIGWSRIIRRSRIIWRRGGRAAPSR